MCAMQAGKSRPVSLQSELDQPSTSASVPLRGELKDDQPSTSTSRPLRGERKRKLKRKQTSRAVGIKNLPVEVILRIFSKISDGATLLNTIPAVCKRWQRVSSDAAAWRGVTLSVDSTSSTEKTVLQHAPAVRDLHIKVEDLHTPHEERPRLRSLLASSQLTVCNEMSIGPVVPRNLRKGYLQLVWQNRHHLKRLTIVLDNETKTDSGHTSAYVLSHMHCLEKLTVYVQGDFKYQKGRLQRGFPNLKSLAVCENESDARHDDLMKDLLRGSLVKVKLSPSHSPRPDLLTALARCQRLTDLVAHWKFAPVFSCLPALKYAFVHFTVDSQISITKIEEAFVSLYTPKLHFLHLKVWRKNHNLRWYDIYSACEDGLETVRNRGYQGRVNYQIW